MRAVSFDSYDLPGVVDAKGYGSTAGQCWKFLQVNAVVEKGAPGDRSSK
jgi:hypothetical protein